MPKTRSHGKEINPALAGFVSGAASTILTIAATLVSLQTNASREVLLLALSWIMYAAAAATALVLAWIVVSALKDSVHELRHLKELEAHVSNFIRYRRRSDQFRVSPNGDAVARFEGEIECAIDRYVPWLTFPIFTDTVLTAPEWKSAIVRLVSVDGVNFDPTELCMRRSRTQTVDDPNIVVEEIAVRIPIALGQGRQRCTYVVEVDVPYLCQLGERDDSFFAVVAHITDEMNLHIVGTGNLHISFSPNADYRVRASQLSGELLDTFESQLQSAECRIENGIHWRTHTSKIGYRYGIRFRGSEAVAGRQ